MTASVLTVSRDHEHRFSKTVVPEVRLLEGLGVEGDAHAGVTVQHLFRIRQDPTRPNLRQVHLVHSELLEEIRAEGFDVGPGDLGENVTTAGVDLLGLGRGTLLRLGGQAVVEVTGLRNPCAQIDRFRRGLLRRLTPKDAHGEIRRLGGIMSVVRSGGLVRPGDGIEVVRPAVHEPLEPV